MKIFNLRLEFRDKGNSFKNYINEEIIDDICLLINEASQRNNVDVLTTSNSYINTMYNYHCCISKDDSINFLKLTGMVLKIGGLVFNTNLVSLEVK